MKINGRKTEKEEEMETTAHIEEKAQGILLNRLQLTLRYERHYYAQIILVLTCLTKGFIEPPTTGNE